MSSRLFPIPLCGAGTAEVESLPSYIHRLTYKHGVYVGELLRFVVRQIEKDEGYTGQLVTLPRHILVHDVLRANGLARGLTNMLEHMTRQCLTGTTIALFNWPLTMSRGELHKGFRWCPECLAEMDLMGEELYFKLIWQFRAVPVCPTHRSPFLEACTHCGCDQTSYIKRRPLGRCQDCGVPLSSRLKTLRRNELANSWQDIGRDVLELFSDLAKYGYDSLPIDGVYQSLDQLFDHYWRQQREKDFYQLLDRDQLLSVIHSRTAFSLNAARKVAFRLGISLYDLLSGNAVNVTRALDFIGFCPLPPSFMDASARFTRDHEAVLYKLRELMADEVEPMSLKAVARELDVSVGYLEYRFAVQVRHIVERNSKFLAEQQLRKRRLAQERALRYFAEGSENAPKSRKQAYLSIREETGLPKFMLKQAIQEAYSVLR